MRRLDSLDKIIFYMAGLGIYVMAYERASDVVPILISITLLGLITYFDHWKTRIGLSIVYSLLIFRVPELSYFLPAILYGVHEEKLGLWPVLLAVPVVVTGVEMPYVLMLGGLAMWLKSRTLNYCRLKTDHLALWDSKRELEESSKKQNQILLEKQDGELHVATLNERNRIAREIHDHVGHQLSSALLQVGALLVREPDNASLNTLKSTLNIAMDNIRDSVHNLYEESIELTHQIQKLVDDFSFCDIRLNMNLESGPEIKVKYALIAVVKEALSNVIKHSNASRVEVTLLEHPVFYQLIVSDNGTVNKTLADEGIGLKNINHRIEALNGHFRVKRENGFELFITIPK